MYRTDHISKISNVSIFNCHPVDFCEPKRIEPNREYLELVIGGTIFFDVNGEDKELSKGALFWHCEGDYTLSKTIKSDPYKCAVFKFDTTEFVQRQVPRVTMWDNEAEVNNFVQHCLKAFYDDTFDRDFLKSYAYNRLLWQAYYSTNQKPDNKLPNSIQVVMNHIDNHLHNDLSLEKLSKLCGISKPHLHSLFIKHLDVSPHQYLLNRRIQMAKNLLGVTDIPIKEVAFECGFNSIENFCRNFKKFIGITPGKFREQHSPTYYLNKKNDSTHRP